jgi:hypothetical protein
MYGVLLHTTYVYLPEIICIPDPTSLPLLLHPFARASPASIVDLEGFDQGSAEILRPPDLNLLYYIEDIMARFIYYSKIPPRGENESKLRRKRKFA